MPGAALALALALASARSMPAPAPPRGMVIAPAPNIEILVAKRSDDGGIETACVDNQEALKAFLARPRAKSSKVEDQ